MWQRIQTLYLALAIIVNLFVFQLDLAIVEVGNLFHHFTVLGLTDAGSGALIYTAYLMTGMNVLSILVSLIIIFLFKKRQLQIKLSQLNLFLQASFVVSIFMMVESAVESIPWDGEATIEYDMGSFLSIVPMIFIYLAIRSIKKDDALVRAADRIR